MMRWLDNLPLASKLRVIIVYATAVALVVASLLFMSGEVLSLRRTLANHLLTLATATGQNTTGALTFGDHHLALDVIRSLSADPNVTAVTLYDAAGRDFVDVSFGSVDLARSHESLLGPVGAMGGVVRFEGLIGVQIQVPVMLDGERIGTIQLRAQLLQLYTELGHSVGFMLLGLLLAGGVAYVLSTRLQRIISAPVNELLLVAHTVRASKDFSIRGVKHAKDEIGALIDGFNDMLAEIETRDRNLRRYQDELELRVRERTISLDIAMDESREALRRAEAANRAKSEFLATMSHEIRTPLNGVLGMNELLLVSELTSRQRECATSIQDSGQHLLNVINDILDFSKIESGHMEFESVDFSVIALVEETLAMFSQPAAKKGLELIAQYTPDDTPLPHLRGDPFRLRQVLSNLVSNSIKFTERGEVLVRLQVMERSATDALISLSVTDTGIGIASEAQDRIFEHFSQADGSTTRRFGGTGLGLAICRRLLTLMGGSISVQSVPGSGSQFCVMFRLPTTSVVDEQPKATAGIEGRRVLLVIDNETHRCVLQRQLQLWNLKVTVAGNAEAALALLRQSAENDQIFDLIMLERQMQGVDGLQLAGAIREFTRQRDTPVLMLTCAAAGVSPPERSGARSLRLIDKPVRRTALLGAVCELLESSARPAHRHGSASNAAVELRGTVLLVEDHPVNQEVASAMLRTLGLQVVLAADGRQAVDLVQKKNIQMVLMDCQMPVMDGFEATAIIRGLPHGRGDLPIIALTANAMQGDEQQCLSCGMNDFLAKPFTLAQLRSMLTRWLPLDAAAGERPASPMAAPQNPASPDVAQAINLHTLEAMRALDPAGSSELMKRIVKLFLQTADQHFIRIEQAMQAGDALQLKQAAHTLKSGAANVGAEILADLYRRLEQLGREQQIEAARELMPSIQREHQRALARMREIVQEAA